MQFVLDKDHKDTLFGQAYLQLLTALHMGQVRAGDRLPSVRQVARRSGLNVKTVLAIYQRLQSEGYVTLRAGSGAYVSDIDEANLEQAFSLTIFRMIKSGLTEAGRLGVAPGEYARLVRGFVGRARIRKARVAVVECNEEQIGLFAHEITERTGINVCPLLLARLESQDRRALAALSRADYVATTHFHFRRVKTFTERYGKRLLQLRLNPAFVPAIVAAARLGTVLMLVSDADYFPAFRRSLTQIGTPPAVVARIAAADHSDLERARMLVTGARTVYVSPISSPQLRRLLPPGVAELKFDGTLAGESLEMLEAFVLFELGRA